MVSLDDCILKEETEEVREISEEDRTRMSYEKKLPDMFIEEPFIADAVFLSPMYSEKKESKAGNEYDSNQCSIIFYSDLDEIQIKFYVENFGNYNAEKDIIVISERNANQKVLLDIIQKIKGSDNNRFLLDYSGLRDAMSTIDSMKFYVEETVNELGYSNYGLKIQYIK